MVTVLIEYYVPLLQLFNKSWQLPYSPYKECSPRTIPCRTWPKRSTTIFDCRTTARGQLWQQLPDKSWLCSTTLLPNNTVNKHVPCSHFPDLQPKQMQDVYIDNYVIQSNFYESGTGIGNLFTTPINFQIDFNRLIDTLTNNNLNQWDNTMLIMELEDRLKRKHNLYCKWRCRFDTLICVLCWCFKL